MEKPELQPIQAHPKRRRSFFEKDRLWLNILLFAVTVLSCITVGFNLSVSYIGTGEALEAATLTSLLLRPDVIFLSLVYAFVLLTILLGHEMGHYLTARKYGVNATLPFFIPAPMTMIGTMGAFIKILSPISRKHQLFDIGAAGPLVSFFLGVPALAYGLSVSSPVASLPSEGSIVFGEPLILKILGLFFFKNVSPEMSIILHPVAFAGWVGILVTALNLFPIGQLDGGHVIYAVFGSKIRPIARLLLGAFVVMGVVFWIGWFVWALLITVIGIKHPHLADEPVPLSPGRKVMAFGMLVIFILSFIPDPVRGLSLLDLFRGTGMF
jgi:membrane-associated protease RseP (regulator of RpoE activity)